MWLFMHTFDNTSILVGDIGFPNFSLFVSLISFIVTMKSWKYNSRDCLDNVESMKKDQLDLQKIKE